MSTAIEFNHVSKQYRLGLVSTKTLSHDIRRFWITNVLHKEDPYLKIGETNDRASKGNSEYVWALRDIDFKVEQGDVVGIIGKNGAGKSTLLKLLSRVTGPTTGTIRAHGRIGSLLEVGTGFHQEMTGRENIYLNGAILGMTKAEIDRKLDEIIDFSGCERYIDTPVKRYSSGMTVRLGFAVAAFLEPEILVVDEVLAVGDAEFQKKAIGKMQDVSKGEGRTVLFVSHNMASVKNLCHNGIVLKNGMIDMVGNIDDCVNHYLCVEREDSNFHNFVEIKPEHRIKQGFGALELEFLSAKLLNEDIEHISSDEPLIVELEIRRNKKTISECHCGIVLKDLQDNRFAMIETPLITIPDGKDVFKIMMNVKHHNLAYGKYKMQFEVGVHDFGMQTVNYDIVQNVMFFNVTHISKHPEEILYNGWSDSYGHILLDKNIIDVSVE